jgi:hypothetical protein
MVYLELDPETGGQPVGLLVECAYRASIRCWVILDDSTVSQIRMLPAIQVVVCHTEVLSHMSGGAWNQRGAARFDIALWLRLSA